MQIVSGKGQPSRYKMVRSALAIFPWQVGSIYLLLESGLGPRLALTKRTTGLLKLDHKKPCCFSLPFLTLLFLRRSLGTQLPCSAKPKPYEGAAVASPSWTPARWRNHLGCCSLKDPPAFPKLRTQGRRNHPLNTQNHEQSITNRCVKFWGGLLHSNR